MNRYLTALTLACWFTSCTINEADPEAEDDGSGGSTSDSGGSSNDSGGSGGSSSDSGGSGGTSNEGGEAGAPGDDDTSSASGGTTSTGGASSSRGSGGTSTGGTTSSTDSGGSGGEAGSPGTDAGGTGGTTTTSSTGGTVPTGDADTVVQISAGLAPFTCQVMGDGDIECWGRNLEGQLGNGTNTNSDVHTTVDLDRPAKQVATGATHACALAQDGTVWCWGYSNYGEVGAEVTTTCGSNLCALTPLQVEGLSDVSAISAGSYHSCAIIAADGTVRCWGGNGRGQLGGGTIGTPATSSTPIEVVGLSNVQEISSNERHNCVIDAANQVRCWGEGSYYRLGTGTANDTAVPTLITSFGEDYEAISVSAGYHATCAALSDGRAKCVGTNTSGALGTTTPAVSVNSYVLGLDTVDDVSAGWNYGCALSDGVVQCWGYNWYYTLGDGTRTSSTSPVLVAVDGLGDVTQITTGRYHACALRENGVAYCWGSL